MIEAIVLAAGLSSRMGVENKLLLPYKGKMILQSTLDAISVARVDRILLITGHESEKIKATISNPKIEIIHNPDYKKGQLTSIKKGIENLSKNCTGFLMCLSDMPLLTSENYDFIINQFTDSQLIKPIVAPTKEQRIGNPKLFHITYQKAILQLDSAQHQGAKKILQKYREHLIAVDVLEDSFFFDVDTPAAYAALLRR